ncbi:MAG: hypothetical protein KFB95_04980 [Simkaniaceae bacterium]|nr:MAG: hypothetical protein KFB95_04980 [Simkaniaceae bacterium]
MRNLLLAISMLWALGLSGTEVAIVTVPKSGTHLIKKLLKLVDEKGHYPTYHTDEFYASKELMECYQKRVLLVRDPRDVCLSWICYIVSGQADGVDDNIRNLPDEAKVHFRELGIDRQLEYVIRGHSQQSEVSGVHPTLIYFPLSPYEVAAKHACDSGTFTCRFENLIGPQGGGNSNTQRIEIKKLLTFLDIQISDEMFEKVVGELFGGTKTFNKGQVGQWKKGFNRKNKKLFQKKCSHLLTTFGYGS